MQNWRLPSVHIRRYTLRPDGFVSVQAGYRSGSVITKPFRFAGNELHLNLSTSAVGWIKIELQDEAGQPLPGFTSADCPEVFGDKLDALVRWKGGADVGLLAGKTVRIRFHMNDADLYSFQFATNK